MLDKAILMIRILIGINCTDQSEQKMNSRPFNIKKKILFRTRTLKIVNCSTSNNSTNSLTSFQLLMVSNMSLEDNTFTINTHNLNLTDYQGFRNHLTAREHNPGNLKTTKQHQNSPSKLYASPQNKKKKKKKLKTKQKRPKL